LLRYCKNQPKEQTVGKASKTKIFFDQFVAIPYYLDASLSEVDGQPEILKKPLFKAKAHLSAK